MKTKVYTRGVDEQGNEADLVLAVVAPSGRVKQDASLYSKATYTKAVQGGVMIRQQLDKHLRAMNLWDDDRQRELVRLKKSLNEGELALEKGGIRMTKAREIALRMREDRAALIDLLSVRSEIEVNTADSLADQANFNYLVAACTVYNEGRHEGKPYFSADGTHASVDAYIERGTTRAANDAAAKMSELLYGKRSDALSEMPENQFLVKHKFVNADLNLIDHAGRRIDTRGRLIDGEGFLVDEAGNRVDDEGNPLDGDGRYKVAFTPFLTEDDQPIVDEPAETGGE